MLYPEAIMMHGYFKIGIISCCVVSDISLFTCKICSFGYLVMHDTPSMANGDLAKADHSVHLVMHAVL